MADDSTTEGQGQGGTPEAQSGGEDLTALKATLQKEREGRKAAEKEAKRVAELEAELAKHREATQTEAEKAVEAARKEATAAAEAQVTERFTARIIRAEVLAAAGGKLADPQDAVAMLDLSQFALDDEFEVDRKAIGRAIDDLVKAKPYLAAGSTKRFQGGADGGPRGDNTPADTSPRGLIRAGLESNRN